MTYFEGHRIRLNFQHKDLFYGKKPEIVLSSFRMIIWKLMTFVFEKLFLNRSREKQETVENSDVNGDFKSWLTRIENGDCSPIEYYYWRTRASLTDNESRSLKSGDENFWRMFRKGLLDDEIFLCDEEDRLVVDRYCTRCSFILEK